VHCGGLSIYEKGQKTKKNRLSDFSASIKKVTGKGVKRKRHQMLVGLMGSFNSRRKTLIYVREKRQDERMGCKTAQEERRAGKLNGQGSLKG